MYIYSTDIAMENAMIYMFPMHDTFYRQLRFGVSLVLGFAHSPLRPGRGRRLVMASRKNGRSTAYDWRHPRYCPRSPDFWRHPLSSTIFRWFFRMVAEEGSNRYDIRRCVCMYIYILYVYIYIYIFIRDNMCVCVFLLPLQLYPHFRLEKTHTYSIQHGFRFQGMKSSPVISSNGDSKP